MNDNKPSKTKTSFYRRLYLAYLIERGINTVPKIIAVTDMPRRTAQDTISALHELDIQCRFEGANKDGCYRILDWGAVNPQWIQDNIRRICELLDYPLDSIT
ncbi:helix-turn-helix domain-containing protein [Pseudomaricurvus alkylphenolicus]|jgi:hypothetical protein|uniref:helix-turn-helix domain-containing protein n=1 Tax=Pseudomaricurvus alkylphenolicus TaxID=1306991 RepID=UPI0014218B00|nr:winged helix-turn-helix domain-containing protein [Pseudomaricurvus alkylphenolicus]NIB40804.1 helix-turn-helix domain-containing protein [Pseudomaricurvus alkylphenolicus]